MAASLFFVYEGLVHVGIFEKLEGWGRRVFEVVDDFRVFVTEASETAREWYEAAEWAYEKVRGYLEPWRREACLGSFFVLASGSIAWSGS